jgi:type IV pilus assembly protein PilW
VTPRLHRAAGWRALGRHQRGITLIELLVAMAIGLGVTLAITSLLVVGENHKRTTTSTNDAEQTGAYAFNALDRVLRGAGSAIAESAYYSDRGVLSCLLNAAANGTKILPRAGAFPSPFGSFLPGATSNLRVAPVLIAANQSPDGKSDVIVAMGGSGAAGGVSLQVTGTGAANTLVLDNTVGFATTPSNPTGDLVLVSQSGTTDCLLEEVSTNVTPTLNLGSVYLTTTGTATTLATLASSTSSYVTPLGNALINNVQFMLIGVDANHTLFSYDLLQNPNLIQNPGAADSSQAIADGVYQMHAIYGIGTPNGNGITLSAWAGPTDTNYDISSVMQVQKTQVSIVAVRVALVVRGEYYDKNLVNGVSTPVSPSQFVLFPGYTNSAGTSLQVAVNLTADEQQYRYRVFEFTVPLRNMILLAGGP